MIEYRCDWCKQIIKGQGGIRSFVLEEYAGVPGNGNPIKERVYHTHSGAPKQCNCSESFWYALLLILKNGPTKEE